MPKTRSKKAVKATKETASSQVSDHWDEFLSDLKTGAIPHDIHNLVQSVLRESYLETNKDLQFYAEKVRFFNKLKRKIREVVTDARRHHAEAVDCGGSRDESIEPLPTVIVGESPVFDKNCRPLVRTRPGPQVQTRGELEDYIDSLEEKLSSVGDDAQLANVDLQNVLQKQQQTVQMLSNISKQLHDTMMAVIRNFR